MERLLKIMTRMATSNKMPATMTDNSMPFIAEPATFDVATSCSLEDVSADESVAVSVDVDSELEADVSATVFALS